MTSNSLSRRQLILERLTRNGILRNFSDPVECTRSLMGIQYQVRVCGEMSIFFRTKGLRKGRLEKLYTSAELVNQWGQRKTLHLYDGSDYGRICDIFHGSNYLNGVLRTNQNALEEIRSRISEIPPGGTVDRETIDALASEYVSTDRMPDMYAPYAIYSWLSNNGLIYQVPGTRRTFVRTDDSWTSDEERSVESMKDMLLRYFTCFGPATRKDFCHMSGLSLSATDSAFRELEDDLDVRYYGGKALYSYGKAEVGQSRPLVLLGKYDPLTVSYEDKTWLASKEDIPRIWQNAGRVEAVIVGRDGAMARWNHSVSGKKVSYAVEPFRGISESDKSRISTRFDRLSAFLGKETKEVTYDSRI